MSDRFNTLATLPNALFVGLLGGAVLSAGCTLSVLDDLNTETLQPKPDAGIDAGPPDDVDGDDAGMDSGEPDDEPGEDAGAADAGQDAGSEKPDSGSCHPVVPKDHKRVFVTSELFSGPLMSLEHMDAQCKRLADAACLGGSWRVWLSDKTRTPFGRLDHSQVPYKRVDGVQIAGKWTQLVDGSLDASISIDEQGEAVTGIVWTATTTAGHGFPSLTCDGWQSSSSSLNAKTGLCTATGMDWTHQVDTSCGAEARVYCFDQ